MSELLPDSGFLSHLEALRQALWRSVAAVGVLLIPCFFAADPILNALVRFTCPPGFKLNYFSPMEPLMVQLKLGLILAVVAAMPMILLQLIRFVTPALYAHERRVTLKTVGAATLLFLTGASIGLFLVTPLMMRFSASYASESLAPVIGIAGFINLVGMLSLSFGIMFQLPIVMVLLVRTGIVEPETLRKSRPVAITAIFLLSAILTPPDVVSQLLLAVPTWFLFEVALFIAAKSPRRSRKTEEEEPDDEPGEEPPEEPEEPPEDPHGGGPENTLDAVYRDSYRENRRKNRRFGMINGHYRAGRSGKK